MSFLVVGCSSEQLQNATTSESTSTQDPTIDETPRSEGLPAETFGPLRVATIRNLLLAEDTMFINSGGEFIKREEGSTVLHRWRNSVLPSSVLETGGTDGASMDSECVTALGEMYRTTQDSLALTLMYVMGQDKSEDHSPHITVGIASYQEPAALQRLWEEAAVACDGQKIEVDGEEVTISALRHGSSTGLSLTSESHDRHIISSDYGHNSITVFTETTAEDAVTLLYRQRAALGLP